jgi:DNA-binding NarL/FixJ family response regulator
VDHSNLEIILINDLHMEIIILTPVRLFGDGLLACFSQHPEISVLAVLHNFASLRDTLTMTPVDLVLVDVTEGINLFDVRAIAEKRPDVSLVALGLKEQEQEVVRCGRAGFTGYVSREATLDDLYQILSDVVRGRLACSPEISGHLMRALFRIQHLESELPKVERALTRREREVLGFLAQGLANKEIARKLSLSVATIKHHVHNVLSKLQLQRRSQAMSFGDAPWIALPPDSSHRQSGREIMKS